MQFFDSHAHYNDEKFNQDKDNVLKEIYNQDITRLVCAGYISPNDVEDLAKVDSLEELLKEKKIVAIGEIGLDYYWNKENKDIQKELFIKQIELANKYNLPIVIHTRDAAIDTIDILKNHPCNKKGVFHCCPLNQELIKEGLKLGFYISFSGNITFKNAKSDACIELVPLDRILIETDSPYLTPEPLRGTRNDSRNVKLVAQKIASVKNLSLEEIAKITYENANRIFNLT